MCNDVHGFDGENLLRVTVVQADDNFTLVTLLDDRRRDDYPKLDCMIGNRADMAERVLGPSCDSDPGVKSLPAPRVDSSLEECI